MPGDFLTSKVNTFPEHIQCELPEAAERQDSTACDFCLYNPPNKYLKNKYGVPLAVIHFKREQKVDDAAIANAKGWTDRFGNSELLIAAGLGVKFSILKSIIDKGANVHVLNTGRQSLLHVIDLRGWSLKNMISLRDYLRGQDFQFYHRDLQGLTFIDYLKEQKIDPLCFGKCWLECLVERDSFTGRIVNYERLMKLFEEIGGTQKQWFSLGWFRHDSSNFAQLPFSRQDEERMQMQYRDFVQNATVFFKLLSVARDICGQISHNVFPSFGIDQPTILPNLEVLLYEFLRIPNQSSSTLQRRANRLIYDAVGLRLVVTLINLNVGINHHDEFGGTPMMALIRSPNFSVSNLEFLLSRGANPDARNREGDSSLHLSTTLGKVEATEALIKHGANVHARNRKGLGVVAAGRAMIEVMRHFPDLVQRIDYCIAILLVAGAVEEPTLHQEWDLRNNDVI